MPRGERCGIVAGDLTHRAEAPREPPSSAFDMSEQANQTAVLFDLGDVLVRLDFPRGLSRLRSLATRPWEVTDHGAALFLSRHSLEFNRGAVGEEAFLARLGRALGASVPAGELAEAWCDIFTPWPEMETLAGEVLASGSPAFLVSNTDPLHFRWLARRMPVLGRLTGLHLSYEVGLIKPDPAYFTAALSRFGLAPERCAYLDDRAEHVAAAAGLGIPSLVFDGVPASARAFLRSRGVRV